MTQLLAPTRDQTNHALWLYNQYADKWTYKECLDMVLEMDNWWATWAYFHANQTIR